MTKLQNYPYTLKTSVPAVAPLYSQYEPHVITLVMVARLSYVTIKMEPFNIHKISISDNDRVFLLVLSDDLLYFSLCRTLVMPSRMCINPIHNKKGILHRSSNVTSEEM